MNIEMICEVHNRWYMCGGKEFIISYDGDAFTLYVRTDRRTPAEKWKWLAYCKAINFNTAEMNLFGDIRTYIKKPEGS